MKKLSRCFKRQPRVVQKIKFDVDGFGDEVKAVVDSDWPDVQPQEGARLAGASWLWIFA